MEKKTTEKKSTKKIEKQTPADTRQWVLIDLENRVLGRAATEIALRLRGKHKATFIPHLDKGEFVVVINAAKIKFTGKKMDDKIYYRHTGYFGGLKESTARERIARNPEKLIHDTVWGMMPKNTLSKHLMKKLKVYAGNEHPHAAQIPTN
ncbi:MAG: 50S ribosomal protein L13 [Pseudomonadota bacterium]